VQPGSDEILTIEPYARPVDRRLIPQTPRHDLDHGDDILRVAPDGSQILGDGIGENAPQSLVDLFTVHA
jgi:hypothetical protein